MKVLVTGSSGLVGSSIIRKLQSLHINFHILSTNINKKSEQNTFYWNLFEDFIDESALKGVTHIIHLAGASIGRKHWSPEHKKTILESRVKSARMLQNRFLNKNGGLTKFVSASAVGFYSNPSEAKQNEDSQPGSGFLSEICQKWEAAADQFETIAKEVVKIRIGLVLSKKDGYLHALLKTAPLRIIPILGSPQYKLPWIHPEDLASIFIFLTLTENTHGVWNAVSPQPINQFELVTLIDKVKKKKSLHPTIPPILLKALLGERSELASTNQWIDSEKLIQRGYSFQYPNPNQALSELFQIDG